MGTTNLPSTTATAERWLTNTVTYSAIACTDSYFIASAKLIGGIAAKFFVAFAALIESVFDFSKCIVFIFSKKRSFMWQSTKSAGATCFRALFALGTIRDAKTTASALTAELTEKNKEIQHLKEQLLDESTLLASSNTTLNKERSQLKEKVAEVALLHETIKEQNQEIINLKEEMENLENQNEVSLQAKIKAQEHTITNLTDGNAAWNRINQLVIQENTSLLKQIAHLQQEKKDLEAKISPAEND